MINFAGLVYQARFIAELHQLHVINDELEIARHEFIPECWCFLSRTTGRSFQLKLIFNGDGCELDYISPAGKHLALGVYDSEKVAERAMDYLRTNTDEI